jgi:hypothetical protein
MSYCHLLSGWSGNISLTLGKDHQYGEEPDRVPNHMYSHVASRAAAYPGCLDYTVVDLILADGFESGNDTAWSRTVD